MQIEFTPEFKRNLRALAKKYRAIYKDLLPILKKLAAGGTPGDQITGAKHTIFKVRVKNSDLNKGKSSGYRLLYFLKSSTLIVLVTIYSKLDQQDITANQIRKILGELDKSS